VAVIKFRQKFTASATMSQKLLKLVVFYFFNIFLKIVIA